MAAVIAVSLALGSTLAGAEERAVEKPAAACAPADLARAVDRAGAALRSVNAESMPLVQSKMRQLRDSKGWTRADWESDAMAMVSDERLAQLDVQASELLDRIDQLSKTRGESGVSCASITEIESTGIELVATLRAKTSHMIARWDAAIAGQANAGGVGAPAAGGAAPASVASAEADAPSSAATSPAKPTGAGGGGRGVQTAATAQPVAPTAPSRPQRSQLPSTAAAQPERKSGPAWATSTSTVATQAEPAQGSANATSSAGATAVTPQVFTPPSEAEGYTIEEIREATRGFFGQISTGLAQVIEHAFAQSGRPTGYILGTEGGGAILAGLRYGEGDLFLRAGGTRRVFWHGPSLGGDLGVSGSKTLFLVYKLDAPETLFSRFTGIDGSAYFVGGVGLTLLTNGRIVMAPIRSGIGLRLGANIGYVRFTDKQTWNPF